MLFFGVAVRPDSCPASTGHVHLNIGRPGLLCADLSNLPARRHRGTGTGQVGSRLGRSDWVPQRDGHEQRWSLIRSARKQRAKTANG